MREIRETTEWRAGVRALLSDVERFTAVAGTRPLRPYQVEAARAIVSSVRAGRGDVISVMMARQMGKNQTSAALELYLLNLFAGAGGQIVKAAPTFTPQLVTSKIRLERELSAPFCAGRWRSEYGYTLRLGEARILFFSADRASNGHQRWSGLSAVVMGAVRLADRHLQLFDLAIKLL